MKVGESADYLGSDVRPWSGAVAVGESQVPLPAVRVREDGLDRNRLVLSEDAKDSEPCQQFGGFVDLDLFHEVADYVSGVVDLGGDEDPSKEVLSLLQPLGEVVVGFQVVFVDDVE